MTISRRFVKKFEEPKLGDDVVGYKNVGELCRDIDALLDILWLSGTRKNLLWPPLPKSESSPHF